MDRKEILDRIMNIPEELPTIEEVDFLIRDNMRETEEVSKEILNKAHSCGVTGEKNKNTYEGKKLLELAREFIGINEQLWKQHKETEKTWIDLKKRLGSTLKRKNLIAERRDEYHKALLEHFEESKMTQH